MGVKNGCVYEGFMLNTPILFIIFNRPDTEKRVFEQIRKIKPKYLFVAADGPRKDRSDDVENCRLAREIVDTGVDWECEVKKLYRDENLGCKYAVSGAIDWFFENVEEGIILEDDCLPSLSFFMFCGELLEKYRNDNNIMHISASNFLFEKIKVKEDYFFSKINHIWGWATWRRAWKKYDVNMDNYPLFLRRKVLGSIWNNFWIERYWRQMFLNCYHKKIDTWDYQWIFATWLHRGLSISPKYNLVRNIGFGSDGTHTNGHDVKFESQELFEYRIKKYPKGVKRNIKADIITFNNVYNSSFIDKVKDFVTRHI